MKDYTEKNPVFMDTIQITETSDPAHADNINAAPMQLLQNTLANKKEIDELKKGSNEVEFDDSGTGTDIPGGGGEEPGENLNPADAIDQITSGKSVPTLIGHIKTALRGLLSLSQNLQTLFFEKISGLPGLIGRAYSEEQVYGIGEYCTHEERFYKFTGSKEIGAWDPDKVQEVTVAEELVRQRAAVQEIVDSMGNPDAYDPNRVYMAGDFCIQNNQMYKRNADMAEDTELPHPWDETEWTATSIAEEIRQLNVNMSHVGMIIHSTTMDTMEKVIAVYGGTEWQKIEGRFLLGSSGSYKNGSTGGESEHKLTVQEMPSHTHSLPKFAVATDNSKNITQYNTTTGVCNSTGFISETSAAGNGKPHNNMPPYKAVYIWERTA